jgi:predicted DNA-binding transcriptional regulator YafY
MSRSSRLFTLLDTLRGYRRPVTAARLGEQLGVSERTIYRDLQTLAELGAPVSGEAGVGFVLKAGMFLPPLMFGADEIEALVLGARLVRNQGDAELAAAAQKVLDKIATNTPKDLRDRMAETSLWVPPSGEAQPDPFVGQARVAIRESRKIRIGYVTEDGRPSERIVWPIGLAYLEGRRIVATWCELRAALRNFRLDRISALELLDQRYPRPRRELLAEWMREQGLDQVS